MRFGPEAHEDDRHVGGIRPVFQIFIEELKPFLASLLRSVFGQVGDWAGVKEALVWGASHHGAMAPHSPDPHLMESLFGAGILGKLGGPDIVAVEGGLGP